jgi:hypothetical protein
LLCSHVSILAATFLVSITCNVIDFRTSIQQDPVIANLRRHLNLKGLDMIPYRSPLSLNALLGVDAVTCLGMGVLLAAFSGPIAALTGISAPMLCWAGLLLFPTAAFMAVFARARQVPGWAAFLVIGGNLLWVLASIALPLAGIIAPNFLGWAFLIAQAAVVAVLTFLEWQAAQGRPVTA